MASGLSARPNSLLPAATVRTTNLAAPQQGLNAQASAEAGSSRADSYAMPGAWPESAESVAPSSARTPNGASVGPSARPGLVLADSEFSQARGARQPNPSEVPQQPGPLPRGASSKYAPATNSAATAHAAPATASLKQHVKMAAQTLAHAMHTSVHHGGRYNHLACTALGVGVGLAVAASLSPATLGVAAGSVGVGALSSVISGIPWARNKVSERLAPLGGQRLIDGLPGLQMGFALAPLALGGPVGAAALGFCAATAVTALALQHLTRHMACANWADNAIVVGASLGATIAVAPVAWLCLAGTAPAVAVGVGLIAAASTATVLAWLMLAMRAQSAQASSAIADKLVVAPAEVRKYKLEMDNADAPSVFNVPNALKVRLQRLRACQRTDVDGVPYWRSGLPIITLDGPPGVGKTTMAKGIATYFDADLIATSASRLASPHLDGGSAGHIRLMTLLFQAQIRSYSTKRLQVVLVDEIGSLFAATSVKRGNAAYNQALGNMMLAYFLGYLNRGSAGVMLVTADNHSDDLADSIIYLSPRRPIAVPALSAGDVASIARTKLLAAAAGLGDTATPSSEDLQLIDELGGQLSNLARNGRHLHHMVETVAMHVRLEQTDKPSLSNCVSVFAQLGHVGSQWAKTWAQDLTAYADEHRNEAPPVPKPLSNRRPKTLTWLQDLSENPMHMVKTMFTANARAASPAQTLQAQRVSQPFGDAFGSVQALSMGRLQELSSWNHEVMERAQFDRSIPQLDTLMYIPEVAGMIVGDLATRNAFTPTRYSAENGEVEDRSFLTGAKRLFRGEATDHPLAVMLDLG